MSKTLSDSIYIYYVSFDGNHIMYDRSMNREGGVYFADRRVQELRKRGKEAFYTIGKALEGALY